MSTPEHEDHEFHIWKYSTQYQQITSEGHSKPPPCFGSPTFVWHVGIWQKAQADEVAESEDVSLNDRHHEYDAHNETFFEEINKFIEHLQTRGRIKRVPEIEDAALAASLEKFNIEKLNFAKPRYNSGELAQLKKLKKKGAHPPYRFRVSQPQSLGFTLWWADSDAAGNPLINRRPERRPPDEAAAPAQGHPEEPDNKHIRVRVQVQAHLDHVTMSFYIDAGKPYGLPQIYSLGDADAAVLGFRRYRIAQALKKVQAVSNAQIAGNHIELDRLPENGISEENAGELLEIANYCYDGIWNDFMESFKFRLGGSARGEDGEENAAEEAGLHGHIFADFRGLVMEHDGVSTPGNSKRASAAEELRAQLCAKQERTPRELKARGANFGIGAAEVFDQESYEPNTVLKSLWPFIRRMVPWADYRDFIGCGIIGGKALYLAPLKSSGAFFVDEESPGRKADVPYAKLPPEREGTPTHEQLRHPANTPIRFLVVTKGQPHREQIGRFVERINSVNTMRLFILKSLSIIRNAGIHIQVLGRELDGVLKLWGDKRQDVETRYDELKKGVRSRKNKPQDDKAIADKLFSYVDAAVDSTLSMNAINALFGMQIKPGDMVAKEERLAVEPPEIMRLEDLRVKELSAIVYQIEKKLVHLGTSLDEIGRGGAGRLLYIINRAKYYVGEFERLWPTIDMVNIDGWISYKQFVDRGMKPIFNRIESTGNRLVSLRDRLQSTTEMIQTSALIIETEATRANTETLKRIASNIYSLSYPLVLAAAGIIWKVLPEGGSLLVYGVKALVILATIYYILRLYREHRKQAPGGDGQNGTASENANRQ